MIVWVVERGAYDARHVAGVYATAEAAKAAHPPVEGATWERWENEWSWEGRRLDDTVSVVPYEVDPK